MTKKEIGWELKTARGDVFLTQDQLARKLGYDTAQYISNWERGVALPPLKKAKKLRKIFRPYNWTRISRKIYDFETERLRKGLGL